MLYFLRKFRRSKRYLRNKEIEPQEILLDELTKKHEVALSESRLEVPISKLILKAIVLLFVGIIVIFFSRIYQLQVIRHKKYLLLAEKNEFTYRSIKADRGVIYDKDHKQLVYNYPAFDLVCKKSNLTSQELNVLQQITGLKRDDLENDVQDKQSTHLRIDNLQHESLIKAEIRKDEIPSCKIENDSKRKYEDPLAFSHLIGYEKGSNQMSGLELFYNKELEPKHGSIIIQRNALGEPLEEKIVSLPQPGNSIILSVDSDLQKKIFDSLKKELGLYNVKAGAAVAMDPRNGHILALVSIPGFDINKMAWGISQDDWEKIVNNSSKPLWDRAINGCYPSGSTIKPLIAGAALEEGVITPKTRLDCPLKICVKNIYSGTERCFSDWKFHGVSDVKRAIAESVDTFFYEIGGGYKNFKGLGIDKIDKYLSLFGLGEKTGVDLPSESKCLLPTREWKKSVFHQNWYIGDTYNISIGQGYLQVSPLQEATAFCPIANGGIMYKPEIVNEVVDNQNKVIEKIKPEIIREGFISPQNLKTVQEGMRQTVTSPNGTAHLLANLPFPSAAKTGTAQSSHPDYYDTWITVFAPYDNPQIVLTIMAEQVKGHHFPVLPVSYNVLNWYGHKMGWGRK